jgi:hypothetical protein
MEAAGVNPTRIDLVDSELLLVFVAVQVVCVVVAANFALRTRAGVLGQLLGSILTGTAAGVLICTQAWLVPLVLLFLPCMISGAPSCGL